MGRACSGVSARVLNVSVRVQTWLIKPATGESQIPRAQHCSTWVVPR